jgi:opacity protein-like surface antigen
MRRVTRGERRALAALLLGLALPLWVLSSAVRAQTSPAVGGKDAEGEEDEFAVHEPRDFHRSGVYIGMGAAYGLANFDLGTEEHSTGISLDSTNSWGVNARVGYRFHPNIGAEVTFDYYQGFEFEAPNGLDAVNLEGFTLTGNGKFYLMTGRFQPYAIAGAGVIFMNADPGAFATPRTPNWERAELVARAGPGVDFYLFDDLLLNVEATYVLPMGALSDYPLASFCAGVQYRF